MHYELYMNDRLNQLKYLKMMTSACDHNAEQSYVPIDKDKSYEDLLPVHVKFVSSINFKSIQLYSVLS